MRSGKPTRRLCTGKCKALLRTRVLIRPGITPARYLDWQLPARVLAWSCAPGTCVGSIPALARPTCGLRSDHAGSCEDISQAMKRQVIGVHAATISAAMPNAYPEPSHMPHRFYWRSKQPHSLLGLAHIDSSNREMLTFGGTRPLSKTYSRINASVRRRTAWYLIRSQIVADRRDMSAS